jgi:hypothetical protein
VWYQIICKNVSTRNLFSAKKKLNFFWYIFFLQHCTRWIHNWQQRSAHSVADCSILEKLRADDYRLDDQRSITGRSKGFFLSSRCPDQLWGASSLLFKGYREFFPGGKARPGRDADHSPRLVPRSRMSRSYTFSPRWRLHGIAGQLLCCEPPLYVAEVVVFGLFKSM